MRASRPGSGGVAWSTPAGSPPGPSSPTQRAYGLGLMIQQTNARGPYPPKLADDGAYVGHGGDTYGFLSEQGYYPTAAATIAVVANEDQRGNFVKNALACGAYKVVANVTMGRDAAVDCAV